VDSEHIKNELLRLQQSLKNEQKLVRQFIPQSY